MKRLWSLLFVLTWVHSQAETNPPAEIFSVPPLNLRLTDEQQLRSEASPPIDTNITLELPAMDHAPKPITVFLRPTPGSVTTPTAEDMSLSAFSSPFHQQLYRRLDEAGYFTRPQLQADSLLDRGIDAIFTSEVFRVGKTEVSCSVLTAIKRRNPLCLLNPIFLDVWW